MNSRWTRRSPALALAALLALSMSGCIIEAPYQSGTESYPVTIDLTQRHPVVTFDVVVTTLIAGSSAAIDLSDVDSRIRVAVTGDADVNRDGEPDGLATFFHASDFRSISVPLRANGDCPSPPCAIQRVIVELLEPTPAEGMTVNAEVQVRYGYPGASRHPGSAMTVEGFAEGKARPAGVQRTATTVADSLSLDAQHPIAIQPITFDLVTGAHARALDLVGEASLVGDAAEARDGYDLSLLWHVDSGRALPLVFQAARQTWAPMLGCSGGSDCQVQAFVRLAFDGKSAKGNVRYGIETTLASYADGGLGDGARLTAAFAPTIATPGGAPRITASHTGALVLERDTVRAEMRIHLAMSELPPPPDPQVLEVPGVVRLTYTVTPPISSIQSGQRYVALSWTSFDPVDYNPGVDLVPDGEPHTVLLNLLELCELGHPCAKDLDFTVYDAAQRGLSKPVTLSYRFDVDVTSFTTDPFPPGAAVSIGPAAPRPTPTRR